MNKRDCVQISAVANGFLVTPYRNPAKGYGWAPEEALVFESMERLTAWVAVHFSKAEPVKAPAPGCEHSWMPSNIGGDLYCTRCGERRRV